MALLFVRSVRSRTPRRDRLVGRRRLAVLAPRRRHLGLRVHRRSGCCSERSCCALPAGRRGRRRRRVARVSPSPAPAALPRRPERSRARRRAVRRPVRQLPRRRRRGRRGPRPDARRRGAGGGRLRAAHRPDADGRRRTCRPSGARSATRETEIRALVDYAGAFGDGPDIPDVDPAAGDLAAGGELYRLNCAACHVASGSGAAIGGGREAPSLMESTPTEIGQAILVGPGAMPVFGSFSDRGHQRRRRATSATCRTRRRPASTTSAAPARSPRAWPRGCSACSR